MNAYHSNYKVRTAIRIVLMVLDFYDSFGSNFFLAILNNGRSLAGPLQRA